MNITSGRMGQFQEWRKIGNLTATSQWLLLEYAASFYKVNPQIMIIILDTTYPHIGSHHIWRQSLVVCSNCVVNKNLILVVKLYHMCIHHESKSNARQYDTIDGEMNELL